MKTIRQLGYGGLWTFLLLMAVSCADEDWTTQERPVSPDEKVNLEIHTDMEDFAVPVSRANETALEATPWVVVFTKSGSDYVFNQAAKIVAGSPATVKILPTSVATRLLVIANDASRVETLVNGFTSSTTLTAARDAMTASVSFTSGSSVAPPYGSTSPLPMSYITAESEFTTGINFFTLNPSIGTSANPIKLKRVVAKVDVQVSASAGFTLTGVGAVNVAARGALIPGSSPLPYYANINMTTDTSVTKPLYLYESTAGTTSLIVVGTYKSATYYYKLAFKDKTSGTVLPINRNTHYRFLIESVTGPGYTTLAEAKAAPASNIIATLKVTDLTSHDLIGNGQYHLGLEYSRIWIYDEEATSTKLIVSTNAPAGLTTNSVTYTGGITGKNNGGTAITSINTNAGNVTATEITLSIPAGTTYGAVVGRVTVKIGNLTKTLTVTRQEAALPRKNAGEYHNFPGDNFTSAVITPSSTWLFVTANKGKNYQKIVLPTPGNISMYKNSNPNYQKRTAEVFLYQSDGSLGRIKVIASQKPEY